MNDLLSNINNVVMDCDLLYQTNIKSKIFLVFRWLHKS